MDDVYTYITRLPKGIREAVMPCNDGYTVYIDETLDHAARIDAYNHALRHINEQDWRRVNVQDIEARAHFQEVINVNHP